MSDEDKKECSTTSFNNPNEPDQDISDISHISNISINITQFNSFCEMIKRNKLIFGIIIGIICLLIIIIPVIIFTAIKSKPLNDTNNITESNITNIEYNKNDFLIYYEETIKTSSVSLNNNLFNLRNLQSKSQITSIQAKYLFNIYEIDTLTNPITYYAYATLINLKKIRGKEEKEIGGKDIREINSMSNDFPIIKFSFNLYGDILTCEIPENITLILSSYIYEFIENIIINIKNRENYIINNNNEYIILENEIKKKNGDITKEKTLKFHIEKGKINEIKLNKLNVFEYDNNFPINFTKNSNFSEETFDDLESLINVNIGEITQSFETKITLSSNENNEKITNNINNFVNSIKFINYSSNIEKLNKNSLKKKNKLSIKNQLRNLDYDENDIFYQPIIFEYPVFKLNILGIKLGLISKISFDPKDGLFLVDLTLNKNNEKVNLFKNEKKTNFYNMISIVNTIIYEIGELIDNKIYNAINLTYVNFEKDIINELNKLNSSLIIHPSLSNLFDSSLEDLIHNLFYFFGKCYNKIYEETQKAYQKFINLDINLEKNIYISDLMSEINEGFTEFLRDIHLISILDKDKLINLIEIINKEIKKFNDTNIDISLFYYLTTLFDGLDNIYNNLYQTIQESIISENNLLYNYIMELKDKYIETNLIIIGDYSNRMLNNESVIQSMKIYYEEENYITKITQTKIWIINIKNRLNKIIQKILEKTNEKYQNLLNSNIELFNNISQEYKMINDNKTSLIQTLKQFIKYNENYKIYNEDLESLILIYFNTIDGRYKIFENLTYQLLETNNNDIIELSKNFKSQINTKFDEIINNIRNYKYIQSSICCDELQEFSLDFFEKYLIPKISSTGINSSIINQINSIYVNIIIPLFDEFNSKFFEKIFKDHLKYYMSEPTEIIKKLNQIKNSLENDFKVIIKELNKILNYDFEISYGLFYNEIKDDLNFIDTFHSQIPQYIYGFAGDNKTQYEEIEYKIISFQNFFLINNNNSYFYKNYNNEFIKSENFTLFETYINDIIENIVYNISKYFNDNICNVNEIVCINGKFNNSLSEKDENNFLLSKIHYSISQLKILYPIIDNLKNNNLFSKLIPNDVLNLYLLNYNLDSDLLINLITNSLNNINSKINNSLNAFNDEIEYILIKNIYNKTNNIDILSTIIEKYAQELFININDYQISFNNFIESPNGINSIIDNSFNKEIQNNLIKSGGNFFFENNSFEKDYMKIIQEIKENYLKKRLNILKDITLSKELIQKINKFIEKKINDEYENIKEKISLIIGITEFEFLNSTYSLNNIIYNSFMKYYNDLKIEIEKTIILIFDKYFQKLIESIKVNLDNNYDNILYKIQTNYNLTYNYFKNKSQKNNYVINKLSKETGNSLKSIVEKLFDKFNEIYNQKTIESYLSDLDQNLNYSSIKTNYEFLENTIIELDDFLINIKTYLTDEKVEFLNNIFYIFECEFNKSFSTVRKYLIKYLETDYLLNFGSKFQKIVQNVNNTFDYIKYLLNYKQIKLSNFIINDLMTIYSDINNKIINIINNNVTVVFNNKIENFFSEISFLIVNNFINKLSEVILSNEFKKKLNNNKIYQLILYYNSDNFKENILKIIQFNKNDLLEQYLIKINTDLNSISNILDYYNDRIYILINNKYNTSNLDVYNIWDNMKEDFMSYFNLSNYINKNYYILDFFNNDIIPYLSNIITIYNNKKNSQDFNLILDNYTNISQPENLILEFDKLTNNSGIISFKYEVERLINNFYTNIYEIFNFSSVENIFSNPLDGFDELRETNKRTLLTYDLNSINSKIKNIEQLFLLFKDSFLQNKIFSNLIYQIDTFNKNIKQSIENINDYYNNNNNQLINEIINSSLLIESIEEKKNNLTKYILTYLSQENDEILTIIDLVKNSMIDAFYNIKPKIESSISTSFNKIYKKIFSQLKIYLFSENITINQFTNEELYLYSEKGEKLVKINLKINSIEYQYNFWISSLNSFIINIFNTLKVNTSIEINIDDLFKYKLNGILGSKEIGFNLNYILENKNIKCKAFVYNDKINYIFQYEVYDFDNSLWNIKNSYNINFIDYCEYNINKIFKNK